MKATKSRIQEPCSQCDVPLTLVSNKLVSFFIVGCPICDRWATPKTTEVAANESWNATHGNQPDLPLTNGHCTPDRLGRIAFERCSK